MIAFLLLVATLAQTPTHYNVSLTCAGVDNVIYLKWNITEIKRIEHDMNRTKMMCKTNYDSCSYAQLNLFGFLPGNMSSHLVEKPLYACYDLTSNKELCHDFITQFNTKLNVKMFTPPEYLIIGEDLINFLTVQYGDVCIDVITNNMNNATEYDFWKKLYDVSDILCYNHFSLHWTYFGLTPLWICNDYHKDTSLRANVVFECSGISCCVTYQQYVIGRANISTCVVEDTNDAKQTSMSLFVMLVIIISHAIKFSMYE